jgi:hypothetical protein
MLNSLEQVFTDVPPRAGGPAAQQFTKAKWGKLIVSRQQTQKVVTF